MLLYVIEDHFLIIHGLRDMLRSSSEALDIVGYSNKIDKAVVEISSQPVDIIIMDLFIGKTDPVSNIRKLKSEFPAIPILVFTAENSLYWKIRILKEGAQGFLVKNAEPVEIRNTIKLVSRGLTIIPAEVKQIKQLNSEEDLFSSITFFDLDILFELSEGMPLKQIAEKFEKSLSTIEKTLTAIRMKVDAKTNPNLVQIFFQPIKATGIIPENPNPSTFPGTRNFCV